MSRVYLLHSESTYVDIAQHLDLSVVVINSDAEGRTSIALTSVRVK